MRRLVWISAIIALIIGSVFGAQQVIAWSDDTVDPPVIDMLANNQQRTGVIGDYCWKTDVDRPALFGPSTVCVDSIGLGPMPEDSVTVAPSAGLTFDLSAIPEPDRVAVSFVPLDEAIRGTMGTPEANPDPPPGYIQSKAHQINRTQVDVSPANRAVIRVPDTLDPGPHVAILTVQPTGQTYIYQAYRIDIVP